MKIAESNVVMSSNRTYFQSQGAGVVHSGAGDTFQSIVEDTFGPDSRRPGSGASRGWLNYGRSGIHIFSANSYTQLRVNEPSALQNALMKKLIQRMMEGGLFARTAGWTIRENGVTFSFTTNTVAMRQVQRQVVSYSEEEHTNFQALGQARTEDGRTIDFNVNLKMSREYMEYMDVSTMVIEDSLVDPLVINVGSEVTEVSDQTFMFDLDGDGEREEISTLGRGSGFLALDKNGDGIINDGNELFGTKSGDGFADLRRYDSDGNGWIDENDEVYFKLKVWCKGKNGEDILMNLKEADVGAIFLGEQATEFTLERSSGARAGVIRSTGIFLRESGGVGTVQHIDLVKGKGGI